MYEGITTARLADRQAAAWEINARVTTAERAAAARVAGPAVVLQAMQETILLQPETAKAE